MKRFDLIYYDLIFLKVMVALRHLSVFLMVVLLFFSCTRKETKKESLDFTKEIPSFTQDRSEVSEVSFRFIDITNEAGIFFKHTTGAFGQKWMPETVGSGGGFFDYDNDGLLDIFLVNSKEWDGHAASQNEAKSKLYRNKGDGTFQDVSEKALINFSLYGMGSYFADYDADGDLDIYITAVGENKLLRNDGGKFTDVTQQLKVTGNNTGINAVPAWSTGAAWVDVDRDGWLDLFVASYVKWTPETDIYITRDGKNKSYATPDVYEGESCRLYRNIKGKYFEDITEKAGVLNHEGKSLGVAIADFNNDNWPDMVVSNDTQPNFLYMNNGDGTFTDKAVVAGIGYDENGRARAGMGIDVADISNDGNLAIAIGNFSQEPLSLYTQLAAGELFQDRAGPARLTRSSLLQLTFGLLFCDFDLDGYQDLMTVNGHIEPQINDIQKDITFEQKPQVFCNLSGRYIDVSDQAGGVFDEPIVGRGIATGDYDNDGDMDVLITVNGGSPKLLRNNLADESNFVVIRLKGKHPNMQAIGAKLYLYAGGIRQQRMVKTGSSYLSQSDVNTTIFGLGDATTVDSLKIIWPTSGSVKKLLSMEINKLHVVEE
ncbi:CRTAC1 family protein [Sunxiuqinia sp. A32]|uniref:CRTAC1 family protein n=1 Tax=Sunxiuqinia sp. A32 TaxID=3461496 RepID=UPI0040459009